LIRLAARIPPGQIFELAVPRHTDQKGIRQETRCAPDTEREAPKEVNARRRRVLERFNPERAASRLREPSPRAAAIWSDSISVTNERFVCTLHGGIAEDPEVRNESRSILVVAMALPSNELFLVALCRALDGVTGFLDLLSDLLDRLVQFLAGLLCRAFLLLAAGYQAEEHCCGHCTERESLLRFHGNVAVSKKWVSGACPA
jgi:hypothetical protein